MCGIAGIITFNSEQVTTDDLKKMTDVISHRGPDGEGQWSNALGTVGLGHRRLSIIDLSEQGKQPMHYANERYTITFNGEIYNYIEIKVDLLNKGYVFKSNSDTEVLMALYDLKKEKCLQDLDGMFAFAIWDEKEQTLFCARDRFGEKPFHYYLDNNRFVFASEIKQFWEVGIEKTTDNNRFKNYLIDGHIDDVGDSTSTFFDKIKKLDAAHYMLVNAQGKTSITKYWQLEKKTNSFNLSIESAAEQFLELFIDSIKIRLRSDVPVGSSLSGGLDSSSIVMLIDDLKGKEVKQNTFSARFKNFAKDEGKHIQEVINACKNVNVHYTWPDENYFEQVFDTVLYHQDEPFGSASIVAQYAVMELAKKNNVTVLLDGQGADEYLAGYLSYYHSYLNQLFYSDVKTYKHELNLYSQYHQQSEPYHRINETTRMKAGRIKKKLLNQPLPFNNQLDNDLRVSSTQRGLKELLRYADRNSMAHSREVRLPFLSHKLVEYVFSLPDEFKINNGWTKFVLRKAMSNILPESICWRVDKIGYEPPQKNWMNTEFFKQRINKARCNPKLIEVLQTSNSKTTDWRALLATEFL